MRKYFAVAAVAMMFAACSKDVMEPQVDALTGTPIKVNTNIVDTRVAGMDSEADFSKFYLNISGDTDIFAIMEKSDEEWNATTVQNANKETVEFVWANGNEVSVSALMCEGVGLSGVGNYRDQPALSVADNQNSNSPYNYYKRSDRLYMKPTTVTPSQDGSITVDFEHLMSKVVINVITNSSEESNPVTNLKVGKTYTSRLFKPLKNEWASTMTDKKDIIARHDSYTDGTSVYNAILVPQDVAADSFYVSFSMDGKSYKWTSDKAVTLQQGKVHTITLKVPAEGTDALTGKAVAVSIKVNEWPSETVVIGDAENDVTVSE